MNCLECGASMSRNKENYHYLSLPEVILSDVDVDRCSQCGNYEVSIPRIIRLNEVIAKELLLRKARLTHAQIKFLRKVMGWSADDVAIRLAIPTSSFEEWESGLSAMSTSEERAFRLLIAISVPVENYGEHIAETGIEEPSSASFQATHRNSEWTTAIRK